MFLSRYQIYRPVLKAAEKVIFARNISSSYFLSTDKRNDDTPGSNEGFDADRVIMNRPIKNASNMNISNDNSKSQEPTFNVDEMILNSTNSGDELNIMDENDNYMDDDDISTEILNVALEYVPKYGWSQKAIDEAVSELEISVGTSGMFKRGAADLVIHFVEKCNIELSEILAAESKRYNDDLTDENIGKFIEKAIQTRLQMIIPYIGTWPQAMVILASPSVASDCFENGTNMVDEIWYHAGDMATDMSWYAKRGALAAIYIATEVFMLQDKSPNFENTWKFLHRRMNDAKTADGMKSSLSHAMSDIANLANAGAVAAQNILGYNNKSR